MRTLLTHKHFDAYTLRLGMDIKSAFEKVEEKDWTVENFKFYTAVSVMASSRIEGEEMQIDSYLKHKLQDVEYLPNLTEKPNDLYTAYEFARDNKLTLANFLHAHALATSHLLPASQRGVVRKGNMVIMEQHTGQIQFEAASAGIVQHEFDQFWDDLEAIIKQELSVEEAFYYAALIHLVFVKIHPFNDGNGRSARLLEKWFLATKLGQKAWYIGSENYYYQHIQSYYANLQRTGLFYDNTDYEKALPFLFMLPHALK